MAKKAGESDAYMIVFANPGASHGSIGNVFFGEEGREEVTKLAKSIEALVVKVSLVADFRRTDGR